jgi:hypothetical protein
VYVFALYAWASLIFPVPGGWPMVDVHELRDFAHFYVQGVIARAHDASALYDIDAQAAILKRVVPGNPDARYPPVHGPQVSVLFAPFARLPYGEAMRVWIILSVIAYGACGYVLWRACPRLRSHRWATVWLLLAAPGFRFDVGFGQTAAIGLICLTAAFLAFKADRAFLAGLAIGSLVYKPQLGLAFGCVFLLARNWSVIAGAVLAVAVQLGIGCLYWGPHILTRYIDALRRLPERVAPMEPYKFLMHSWRSFFDLLHLPPTLAIAAYLVAAIATIGVAFAAWRSRGSIALRFSALIVATVLVDPHLWVYDFILMTPALLLVWDWAIGQEGRTLGDVFPAVRPETLRRWPLATVSVGLAYFCYFSPLLSPVAEVIWIQLSVLALFAMMLVLAKVLTLEARASSRAVASVR